MAREAHGPGELRARIAELTGRMPARDPSVFEDTTQCMHILGGSVLRIGGREFLVLSDAREGRFGIDDEPKFWVKYVLELESGERKIIKLVFHEEFTASLGVLRIRCRRNPEKERIVLEAVRGDHRFMQGVTERDTAGNAVRIIDLVPGRTLLAHVSAIELTHEQYFRARLPAILEDVLGCMESLALLHARGLHHGDVRNDHLILDDRTGKLTWIDFDYEVNYLDYDVWCMGNILNFIFGKGFHTIHDIEQNPDAYPNLRGKLGAGDMVMLYRNRVACLSRLFPWIPPEVDEILVRFSVGAPDFYNDLDTMVGDVWRILRIVGRGA